jgi:hypothetical protein
VALERKKKMFASYSLSDLLEREGINLRMEERKEETWCPLHYFDDETFDDYACEEWISKQIDEDGRVRVLTGRALVPTNTARSSGT